MRIFYGFDDLPALSSPVVTVGSYDGVHRGHRELLGRVVELARERGGESVVVTFSPHPREVLDPENVKLLNTPEEKVLLLEGLGVDNLIVAPFTAEFSRTPYAGFVRDYLVGRLGVSALVVGYNHHFGAGKEGNAGSLAGLAGELGFDVVRVECHDVEGAKVSSTVIRGLVSQGRMDEAARLLGYRYFTVAVVGNECRVTPGSPNKLLPPAGTYDVAVEAGGRHLRGRLEVMPDGGMRLIDGLCSETAGAVTVTVTFE